MSTERLPLKTAQVKNCSNQTLGNKYRTSRAWVFLMRGRQSQYLQSLVAMAVQNMDGSVLRQADAIKAIQKHGRITRVKHKPQVQETLEMRAQLKRMMEGQRSRALLAQRIPEDIQKKIGIKRSSKKAIEKRAAEVEPEDTSSTDE